MQHAHNKPLHRTTIWRRLKRSRFGLSRRGRREYSEREGESFVAFAGAVIALLKNKGHADYAELFPAVGRGNPRRYYSASGALLGRLAKSGFPPMMLATAVCELVPLNFETRGGPLSASAVELKWKARTPAKLGATLRAEGYSENDIAEAERDVGAAPEAERQKLLAVLLGSAMAEDGRHFFGLRESQMPVSCKGTPVHRVNFIGVEISRAMASYWRNHRQYKHCKAFLRGLLPSPLPSAPYRGSVITIPRELNAKVLEYWRKRRAERRSATASA